MSEPKTIREYRVALRYAQGEARIAHAEVQRLREASRAGACPCCGETYTPAPDEIDVQCACENENCDENCPHVGHLFSSDTSEIEERFWKGVGEHARQNSPVGD